MGRFCSDHIGEMKSRDSSWFIEVNGCVFLEFRSFGMELAFFFLLRLLII